MNFKDLTQLSDEEKIKIFKDRYGHKLYFAGRKHNVVERVITLNNNSKPNPERLAVIEGIWAMGLAEKYNTRIKYLIICIEQIKSIESQKLVDSFVNKAEEVIVVSDRVYALLSEKENGQGIMGVVYLDFVDYKKFEMLEKSLIVVLDGLEIPGNVGTILRSSDAVGADLVILNNRKVRINHPKLIRSSMGSVFKVPISESADADELLKWLALNGYEIILADTDSKNKYFDLKYQNRVAIVMGSEKYGISEDFYKAPHTDVMIPMLGDMDSLNVGVAATILLYEAGLKNKGILNNR
ncbi:MAG: TrmH family RNA methyltransferase [Clostridiaceae bacterium]